MVVGLEQFAKSRFLYIQAWKLTGRHGKYLII